MPRYLRPSWIAATPHGATPQNREQTIAPGSEKALMSHRIAELDFWHGCCFRSSPR